MALRSESNDIGLGTNRGYSIGPTLAVGERPWPIGWEQNERIHSHRHDWELVLIPPWEGRRMEEAVRCSYPFCHVPRCGHSIDVNPCMEIRHHRGPHLYLNGGVEPVGGYR